MLSLLDFPVRPVIAKTMMIPYNPSMTIPHNVKMMPYNPLMIIPHNMMISYSAFRIIPHNVTTITYYNSLRVMPIFNCNGSMKSKSRST